MGMVIEHFKTNMGRYSIVLLLVALLLCFNKIKQLQSSNKALQDGIEYSATKAELWKDEYGRAHAQNKILELDRDNLIKLYNAELKKDFSIKAKNAHSITKIVTVNADTVTIPISADNSFKLDGLWTKYSGHIQGQTLFLERETRDSISFVTGYKRRLFRPGIYTVEAISHNPSTVFKSLESIEIKEKPKRISLGVGVYYTNKGWAVGAGLQYSLIRF
jgi:hypothetical protein